MQTTPNHSPLGGANGFLAAIDIAYIGWQRVPIYRFGIAPNKLIMGWLPHRGGALDYRAHCTATPTEAFPVAVALGADPATLLSLLVALAVVAMAARPRVARTTRSMASEIGRAHV